MPFSFGIVIGFLTILVGVVLYVTTQKKKAAIMMVGIGAVMAFLTLVVVVLAVNSGM